MKQNKLNPSDNFVPERLREARMARGLSTSELAEKLGVTRQSVSQYENGQITPSGKILSQIYEVLDFPISFFKKPVSPIENNNILFRSLMSAKRNERDMILSRLKLLKEIFLFLEEYIEFPKVNLPNITYREEYTEEEIENIALYLRHYWGVGKGPIKNLTLLLEKYGFIISRMPIVYDSKIDACNDWFKKRPFIFLVSDKDSAVRSRFNLAHELGHIVLHNENIAEDKKQYKKMEKEAHRFASAFLLPQESFSREIMSTSLEHLIALKKRWLVSIAAMIYRCEDLGIFSKDQILYLRKKIAYKKMRTKEPLDDILKPEMPSLLKQSIMMLLKNNITTKYDIRDKFSWRSYELEQICGLPEGTLSLNEKVIQLDLKRKKRDTGN